VRPDHALLLEDPLIGECSRRHSGLTNVWHADALLGGEAAGVKVVVYKAVPTCPPRGHPHALPCPALPTPHQYYVFEEHITALLPGGFGPVLTPPGSYKAERKVLLVGQNQDHGVAQLFLSGVVGGDSQVSQER